MVLIFLLFLLFLLFTQPGLEEISASFVSRTENDAVTYTFRLPKGSSRTIYAIAMHEGSHLCYLFSYKFGGVFYITDTYEFHPNYNNLQNAMPFSEEYMARELVNNDLILAAISEGTYTGPYESDVSGHNAKYRYWRDYQTCYISYGYLKAGKKKKAVFDDAMSDMVINYASLNEDGPHQIIKKIFH